MKQIYFSTNLYFHSTSPEIKDISRPLIIVSCISCFTPEQYTIKRFNTAAIRTLICFSRLLNLHSVPGLALLIEISCSPKWLGFLEKDLLLPKDSSFLLGIQLGTYMYNRRWNNLFRILGQQKSLITKSLRTNAFQRNLFETLTLKQYISLALIPTTHQQ